MSTFTSQYLKEKAYVCPFVGKLGGQDFEIIVVLYCCFTSMVNS